MNYYDKIDESEEKLNQEITALGLKQRYGRLKNKIKKHSSIKKESDEDLYDDDYLDESVIDNIKARIIKPSNRSIANISIFEKIKSAIMKAINHHSSDKEITESSLYELSFFKKNRNIVPKKLGPYTEADLKELIDYIYNCSKTEFPCVSKSSTIGLDAVQAVLNTDEKTGESKRAEILKRSMDKWEKTWNEYTLKRKTEVKNFSVGNMQKLFNKIIPYIDNGGNALKSQEEFEAIQKLASKELNKIGDLYEKFVALRTKTVNKGNNLCADIDSLDPKSDKCAYAGYIYNTIIYDFAIKEAEYCSADLLSLMNVLRAIKKL